MQPISAVLQVLKTKFSDAYVLASNGDVVIEKHGRKRGKSSVTIVPEGVARTMARKLVSDTADETMGALAGLTLFFDFQRQLGETLEEAEIWAEIKAEEEDAAIAAALAAGLIVPAVVETALLGESAAQTADEAVEELAALAHAAEAEALLDPGVAPEYADALSSLKPLGVFAYQFFHNLGITTIPGLVEALETPTHYDEWGAHAKNACQALFTHSGGDEVWLERAAAARESSWTEEEAWLSRAAEACAAERASSEAEARTQRVERVLDPGQFHGADGAEEAHVKAKAETRKLSPVARFMVDGRTYARQLDRGTANEVRQLQADITKKWGEILASVAFTTLKVSWA